LSSDVLLIINGRVYEGFAAEFLYVTEQISGAASSTGAQKARVPGCFEGAVQASPRSEADCKVSYCCLLWHAWGNHTFYLYNHK